MKHFYIFNGPAAIGKSKLMETLTNNYGGFHYIPCSLFPFVSDDAFIEDDFWFYNYDTQDYDREKIQEVIDLFESGEQVKFQQSIKYRDVCIIVCHESFYNKHVSYLIQFIKDYYKNCNKEEPAISYVEFKKM